MDLDDDDFDEAQLQAAILMSMEVRLQRPELNSEGGDVST